MPQVNRSWIQDYYPAVQIPKLARIEETRGQIAEDIDTLFNDGITKADGTKQPIRNPLFLTGPTTQHFAKEIFQYSTLFKLNDRLVILGRQKKDNCRFWQGHKNKIPELVKHAKKKAYDFIVYVGSQNVADTAKAVAFECKILTGGVITAISSDGLFSDTASLLDPDGKPTSDSTVAPYFVLGHLPTLLRSPTNMKAACLADILTNHSSLWDYDFSCSHSKLAPSDMAKHFASSAADLIGMDSEKLSSPLVLSARDMITGLFRATELCGLSMQLNWGADGKPTSATCSGSEHNIEKKIREWIAVHNITFPEKPILPPLHGEILGPCLLLTLVLQGQTDTMVNIREVFKNLDIPTKAIQLGISDEQFVACVLKARGARAPCFVAKEKKKQSKRDPKLDRLTVLENIECETLQSAVIDAMKLAEIDSPGS